MRIGSLLRSALLLSLMALPAFAGDYDHLFDVIRQHWPERTKAVMICNLEANQLMTLELVETAKAKGLSLAIININEGKDIDRILATAFGRNPDFMVLVEDDPIVGVKSPLANRIIGRALARKVPSVGLDKALFPGGLALAVGANETDPPLWNEATLKKLGLAAPAPPAK